MELAVFGSLDKLERMGNSREENKVEHAKNANIEKQKKKLQILKEKRDALQQKLQEKHQVLDKLKDGKSDLKSFKDSEKHVLCEIEKQRLQQLLVAYRLTGTSLEVISENIIRLRFDTSYKGSYYEPFYTEVKKLGESYNVIRHTLPSFIPLDGVKEQLSNHGIKGMSDYINGYLRAYIERREEAFLVQNQYADLLKTELCSSPSFDYIEIHLADLDEMSCIKLLYEDLNSTKPTKLFIEANEEVSEEVSEKIDVLKKELKSSPLSIVFEKFFDN